MFDACSPNIHTHGDDRGDMLPNIICIPALILCVWLGN